MVLTLNNYFNQNKFITKYERVLVLRLAIGNHRCIMLVAPGQNKTTYHGSLCAKQREGRQEE